MGAIRKLVMATYAILLNFTDQGIRHVKDTTKRADAFKEMATSSGVTVKNIYWTLGRYDLIALIEASDDMTATALGLSLGKAGNLRSETLRAFTHAEMSKILGMVA